MEESANTRGLGRKRVARFPVSTTSEFDHKLNQLVIATGGRHKSRIADEILRIGLDSPEVVNYIQDKYGGGCEDHHVSVFSLRSNGKEEIVYYPKSR